MAVITVKVVVNDIDSVITQFDKIKIYRATTETGTYSEITGVSTRLSLAAGTTSYEYVDTSGDPDYYYKSSYYNSVSTLESSQSSAIAGEGDPALDIMSVAELKELYLFGLDLTNDEGTEYPDSVYEHSIRSAVSWLETVLDLPITPKVIVAEEHDFYREDYDKYMWVELDYYPVIGVDAVNMVLPNDVTVMEIDSSWIHIDKRTGVLQIVPGTGTASSILLGASGAYLPFVYGGNRRIPSVFQVDYTAGFDSVPADIKDAIGMQASFGPLNIAGDLLGGAGIASQSISLDGLSQSFNTTSSATNAGYGSRLIIYGKKLKEMIPVLKKAYKVPPMVAC